MLAGACWAAAAFAAPLEAADADLDGDLLPDAWETQWGLNPNNSADADLDPDGDRLTNHDEFYAGTNPAAYTAAADMSERQVLDLFKGKAFLYFWEQSRAPYYFTADNAHYDSRTSFSNDFNSIATTGFSLVSYVVADEQGWISHVQAYERIRALLTRVVALQQPAFDVRGVPAGQQGNRHGYLYHFVSNQGTRSGTSEISTIDHALFLAGALTAAEYYKGTEVEQLARQAFLNTDWNWLYDGTFLAQGWLEDAGGPFEGGRTLDQWDRYSELLVLLLLAMGHPEGDKALPSSAWDNQTRGTDRMFPNEYVHLVPGEAPQHFAFNPNMPNTLDAAGFRNTATEVHYLNAGSLHTHQYSHLFVDFRSRRDRYATDFFANAITATLADRRYCINLNRLAFGGNPGSPDPYLQQPYETYSATNWGLMAGLASTGYRVLQPIVAAYDAFTPENLAANNDSGTVVLSAALGSAAFTPREALDMARDKLDRFQQRLSGYDALIGRYGFRNAFNLGRTSSGQVGHFPSGAIGLDFGPVVGNIENLESGLPWKFLMRHSFVQQGLAAAGFPGGNVEPGILNFDDNPPAPHEDTNGGGQDPQAFGGDTYAWGSGSTSYVAISDPFPAQPYGPQQWAWRIEVADATASGAFTLLKNHSVSRWDRLSFWIRGETGQEVFEVGLKDRVADRFGSALQAAEAKQPIAAYHPSGRITTTWAEVRMPLRVFADSGVQLTALDNLSFTNAGSGGTIYVDDIAFLGDEWAPAAPAHLQLTKETDGAVTLTWDANVEPDVVGYRVYRSADGQPFAVVNARLIVAETYTDADPAAGLNYYRVTAVDHAETPQESAPSAVVSTHVNRAPQLQPIGPKNVAEGQALSVLVAAVDPDGEAPKLSAVRGGGGPLSGIGAAFADYGDGTGAFTWIPTFIQAGDYRMRFKAKDAAGLKDTEVITVTVADAAPPPPDVRWQKPVVGRTIDVAAPFIAKGAASAAPGAVISTLVLRAWDVFEGNVVYIGPQPVTVTGLETAAVSWRAKVRAQLVPAGHTLRLRAVAFSTPASTAPGRAGVRIDPSGLVQAD